MTKIKYRGRESSASCTLPAVSRLHWSHQNVGRAGNSDRCTVGRKPRDSGLQRSSLTTEVADLRIAWPRGQTNRREDTTPKTAGSIPAGKAGASSARERVRTKRRKRSARLGGKVETEVQGGDAGGVVEDAEGDGVREVRQEAVEVGGVHDDAGGALLEALVEHAEEELQLAGDAGRGCACVGEHQAVQRLQRPEQEDLRVEETVRDIVLQAHEIGATSQRSRLVINLLYAVKSMS